MIETQVLITVFKFFGFLPGNHFLEEDFTFQWKSYFSVGGILFLTGGHPMGGIGFDVGGYQKNYRIGADSQWEKLPQGNSNSYDDLVLKIT